MGSLESIILPPLLPHLPLLPYLILFMLSLYLLYTGITLVTSIASMIVGAAGTGGDRELADVGLKNPVAWLVLGVLPLLCLIFLVGQHLYGAPVAAATMLSRVALLALPAFLGLALYRKTRQPVYGGPAILLLLASTFFLFSTLGLIYTPERWPLIHGPLPGIFAVSVLVDFMTYLSLSVVAGGAAILFFCFTWPDRRLPEDHPARTRIAAIGKILTLGGTLVSLPLLIWSLAVYPLPSVTPVLLKLFIAVVFVLALIARGTLAMLFDGTERLSTFVFVLSICLLGFFAASMTTLQAGANREQEVLLAQSVEKSQQELQASREALYASAVPADANMGEKIFNERCSACHKFDVQVVGPAYNTVLPKYVNDPDGLMAFIRNPVKINPDLPPMPNQGLNETEIKAVATYLITHFEAETEKGGTP